MAFLRHSGVIAGVPGKSFAGKSTSNGMSLTLLPPSGIRNQCKCCHSFEDRFPDLSLGSSH